MKKVFGITLLFSACLINSLWAQQYSKDVERKIQQVENSLAGWVQTQDSVKWALAERMAFYHLNGLSIAVIHNHVIEWAKGYGWADTAEKRPVTVKTLFQAASISKSLNGVGLMKLAQDKKIDLYADVNQYLTTWKFPYDSIAKNKTISVANLLSHTAGLTVHGFAGYQQGDSIPSITQVLDGVRPANSPAVRSEVPPGIKSVYSGGGITISQLVLTDVTGQPYDGWMYKNVLQPLGMASSSYAQPPLQSRQQLLATGYKAWGEAIKGKYHTYPEQAAAGLWTNPTDLSKYIIETQLSYTGGSAKVLSKASTIIRLTPYIDSNAAMGVFVTKRGDDTWFSHGGANEGFRSQYYGDIKNGNGVVVMVNSDNGGILQEVVNSVATVYNWDGFYKPAKKTVIALPEATAKLYVGNYLANGDTLKVSLNNGHLFLDGGDGIWKMYFTTEKDFFVYEAQAALNFIINQEGKVTGINIDNRLIAKKIE
jgi:CubicO group peptidase (beta-lactamase class C family)